MVFHWTRTCEILPETFVLAQARRTKSLLILEYLSPLLSDQSPRSTCLEVLLVQSFDLVLKKVSEKKKCKIRGKKCYTIAWLKEGSTRA